MPVGQVQEVVFQRRKGVVLSDRQVFPVLKPPISWETMRLHFGKNAGVR